MSLSTSKKLNVMIEDLKVIYNECTNKYQVKEEKKETIEELLKHISTYKEMKSNLSPTDPLVIKMKMHIYNYIEKLNLTKEDAFNIRNQLLQSQVKLTPIELELQTRRKEIHQRQRERRQRN